jgi:hypothetical protein
LKLNPTPEFPITELLFVKANITVCNKPIPLGGNLSNSVEQTYYLSGVFDYGFIGYPSICGSSSGSDPWDLGFPPVYRTV